MLSIKRRIAACRCFSYGKLSHQEIYSKNGPEEERVLERGLSIDNNIT